MNNELFSCLFLGCEGKIIPRHPAIKKILQNNISLAGGYIDREDLIQEMIIVIQQATDKFLNRSKKEDAEQYLIDNINNNTKDKVVASYFKYLTIKVTGALKNKYLHTKEEDISFDILENIIKDNIEIGDNEGTNYFCKWFKSNYKRILTSSQINFINNDLQDKNKHAKRRRDAIKERINNVYKKEIGIMDNKNMELKQVIEGAGEISNAKDNAELRAALKKYRNEYFYIEAIYSLKTTKEEKQELNNWIDNDGQAISPKTIQKIKYLFTAIYIDLGALLNLRLDKLEANIK